MLSALRRRFGARKVSKAEQIALIALYAQNGRIANTHTVNLVIGYHENAQVISFTGTFSEIRAKVEQIESALHVSVSIR